MCDISAAEPSIISQYSGDKNYIYAAFEGVGKPAYYSDKDLLMLDDVYLMLASRNPVSRDRVREAFNDKYGGVIGFEQWAIDKSVVKAEIKSERAFNKPAALGIGYSMQGPRLVTTMYNEGKVISLKDAKQVVYSYWHELFPDVAKLRDYLQLKVKKEKQLINPFGFRMTPPPRKALNYFIQSSVNGIIDMLMIEWFESAPYIEFCTIIHDEIVIECPEDKLDEAKLKLDEALVRLNKTLNWSVNIRMGWEVLDNWYDPNH